MIPENYQYRILIADNDPGSLRILEKTLELEGYKVFTASSPIEARDKLNQVYTHIAVFDMRLTDDSDLNDRSGLDLAKRISFPELRIIWTRFPSANAAVESLRKEADSVSSIVDFISKEPPIDTSLLPSIKKHLNDHLKINHDLRIINRNIFFEQCVLGVLSDIDLSLIGDHVLEIEDLFRKHFYEVDKETFLQINVEPLNVTFSNQMWLKITAYTHQGSEWHYICLCSVREVIAKESANFHKFSPVAETIFHSVRTDQTIHFGLTSYRLNRIELDDLVLFGDFLLKKNSHDRSRIMSVVTDVFERLLIRSQLREKTEFVSANLLLIAHGTPIEINQQNIIGEELFDYTSLFGDDQIASIIRRIYNDYKELRLDNIRLSDQVIEFFVEPTNEWVKYPNLTTFQHDILQRRVNRTIGIVHGALNTNNIIVNRNNLHASVINYGSCRTASRLYDYVALELSVRLGLIDYRNDISTRYRFEEILRTNGSDDRLPPDLDLSITLIRTIRSLATEHYQFSYKDYAEDLFVHTLVYLKSYPMDGRRVLRRNFMPYIHLLLLASQHVVKLNPMQSL